MAIFRGSGGAGDATGDATNASALALAAAAEAQASASSAASSATNAANSASAAAADATDAATSETNAAGSASDALASENAAASSASDAADSASAAATSATNAASSASTASTQATNASNSASSASTSATNAANSATSASTSASSASTSATTASTAATNAGNSATAAATSATNAAASASTASTQATNASNSATSAASSATAASSSASSASSSASSASTSATNAASSASSASTSASSAATSATNAANSASAAATSATNAANSATSAAASAAAAATFDPALYLAKSGNLSGLANTATARDNLGVEIGVDVQAFNAALAAIAANNGTNMMKNRIINGAMGISQWNGTGIFTPADNTYTLDRWKYNAYAANKFTCQQTPSATESGYATRVAAGFTNYMAWTVANAYTPASFEYFIFNQRIEGLNVADLAWGTANAKPVTLSFLVYSSLTGTHSGAITNSAEDRSYPFSFTVSSANTWTSVSITISGDTSGTWLTNNGIGINVQFNLGANANRLTTSGAWAAGTYVGATGSVQVVTNAGATFYITGVQLEKGSIATSFDYRPYTTEMQLCQRYYQKVCSSYAGTQIGNERALAFAYSMWVPMRSNPASDGFTGSFHRPGIAFYAVVSIDSVQDANGSGYSTATIAAGAGTGTQGQLSGQLALKAEL